MSYEFTHARNDMAIMGLQAVADKFGFTLAEACDMECQAVNNERDRLIDARNDVVGAWKHMDSTTRAALMAKGDEMADEIERLGHRAYELRDALAWMREKGQA